MLAWPNQVSGNSPVYLGQWGSSQLSHIDTYFVFLPKIWSHFIMPLEASNNLTKPLAASWIFLGFQLLHEAPRGFTNICINACTHFVFAYRYKGCLLSSYRLQEFEAPGALYTHTHISVFFYRYMVASWGATVRVFKSSEKTHFSQHPLLWGSIH